MNLSARSVSQSTFQQLSPPVWRLVPLILGSLFAFSALGADLKLEAQLVWGTNEKFSPNREHKPVSPEVKKKLQDLPLKWSNYFEVQRVLFRVPASGSTNIALGKCELAITNLGSSNVSVTQISKGKRLGTRIQALPRGETLILGGNAPGESSWLGVIYRLE